MVTTENGAPQQALAASEPATPATTEPTPGTAQRQLTPRQEQIEAYYAVLKELLSGPRFDAGTPDPNKPPRPPWLPAQPKVTSVYPEAAKPQSHVWLYGEGLRWTARVTFGGGATANVHTVDAGAVGITVPSGAQDGPIVVTTRFGDTASSPTFAIPPSPTVVSVDPAKAKIGAQVVLAGQGLRWTEKVVFAGGAAAQILESGNTVRVKVPSGAQDGQIVVTTRFGETAASPHFDVDA